jgi:hypothetical protein
MSDSIKHFQKLIEETLGRKPGALGDGYSSLEVGEGHTLNPKGGMSQLIAIIAASAIQDDLRDHYTNMMDLLGPKVPAHLIAAAAGQILGELLAATLEYQSEYPDKPIEKSDIAGGYSLKEFADVMAESVRVNVHSGFHTRQDQYKARQAKQKQCFGNRRGY